MCILTGIFRFAQKPKPKPKQKTKKLQSLTNLVFKSSKCFTSHGHISCLTYIATGLGARRRCSSSAPGHCQSRLEGFGGAGLDYAGVMFVPGSCGSWEERLFVLFSVTACYS